MKINELVENLDWRAHQNRKFNHDDILSDIEDEMITDIKNAEAVKKTNQSLKPKEHDINDRKAGPAGHYPNKSNPNAGNLSGPMSFGTEP